MKKIISLLSVFAIIVTMFTSVAMAGGNRIYFEEKASADKNKVELTLIADMSEGASNISGQIDLTDVFAAGITTTYTAETGVTFRVVNSSRAQAITFTALDTDSSDKFVGKVTFGTVTFDFSNATVDSVAFKQLKPLECASKSTKLTITNDAFTYVLNRPKAEFKPGQGNKFADGENSYVAAFIEAATTDKQIKVTETTEGVTSPESKIYDLPTGLKGDGTIKILPIIKYAGTEAKTFAVEIAE